MESSTSNGMRIKYVESTSDVKLLEWVADNLSEMDLQTLSPVEILEKYEIDTTGDYLKKVKK
ncbi:MAG: hypothetical protein QF732_03665 [Nitrospinaceae bacterium]|jgi:hypothetical protein|nr:hypothetical protein [Nitrospinaceae bacterium]